jgi:hypothetical protein
MNVVDLRNQLLSLSLSLADYGTIGRVGSMRIVYLFCNRCDAVHVRETI